MPDEIDLTVRAMPRRFTGRLGSLVKYVAFLLACVPLLFRRFDVVHIHYFVPLGGWGWLYRRLHRDSRLFVTFHGGRCPRTALSWLARPPSGAA